MSDKKNNWDAWVDTMPPQHGGKLHVHGDIKTDGKVKYTLTPAVPQGFNPKILILKITPKPSEGNTDVHLEYNEELKDPKKYTQIQIEHPPAIVDIRQVQLKS